MDETEESKNPYMENSVDVHALDTRNISDQSLTNTIRNIELGQKQYESFVNELLK